MMCHVLGVQSDQSLRRAAHLGIAMQLTNICRDVAEDWQRGRLYIPDTLCVEVGAGTLRQRLGEPLDALPRDAIAHAVQRLLVTADGFYRSGDRGITALPWRAGMAVRAARSIYASIGTQLARRRFDPLQGRAIVSPRRKVVLALGAMLNQFAIAPAMLVSWIFGRRTQQPTFVLRFPDDVLPL